MFHVHISLGIGSSNAGLTLSAPPRCPLCVTSLTDRGQADPMADWIAYGVLAILLLLVFFFYLMIRRTVLGYKEGVERGKE